VVALGRRWLVFNAVGLIGVGVQLGALALFTEWLHWHYLVATAAAVETAVLHNFAWHEVWTWRDRREEAGTRAGRLLRFHLGNGFVSIAANVGLMRVFTGMLGWPVVWANLVCIAIAALLNFAVSEWWVFRARRGSGQAV
jgi:putative flippase GtrA